ncbi:PREDICTED: transcriptional activator hap3-like [Ipomoea nil]|uniref:transcriptional activator hap3-like n=1 Tax=Ipomoea nil TaxID=35883 RepID=UPI000901FD73|nr:PREDICTED: transcriptional activator hap3-like [Ipomoea nil]
MAENWGAGGSNDEGGSRAEQDQQLLLPIANVGRIMKQRLPQNAKISKEAKETMQECASEFIGFVTGEASDKCRRERRKTVNGDDICWALGTLGFDDFVGPLKRYLHIFREQEGDQRSVQLNNNEDSMMEDHHPPPLHSPSSSSGQPSTTPAPRGEALPPFPAPYFFNSASYGGDSQG